MSIVILPLEDVLGLFFHPHGGDFHTTIRSSRYRRDIRSISISRRGFRPALAGNTWSRWIDWQRFNRVVNKTYVPPSRYRCLDKYPTSCYLFQTFPVRFLFFLRYSLFFSFFFREGRRDIEVLKVFEFCTGKMIGGMLVLWDLWKDIWEKWLLKRIYLRHCGFHVSLFYYFFGIHRNVKKDCVILNEIYKMNVWISI